VETKVAAWTAMSNLATDKNLDSLMKQIVKISNDKVRAAAINAIKNICTNSGDRRKCFSSIAPYYAKADKNLKTLILNIGATTGGVKALDTAKTALASSDAEIRIAAIRALMAWRDSGAADTLLDIAQNGKTDKDKILALRGYIQVTGKENTRTRVKMYMKAAKLAKSSGAKNMIISGLRRLNQFDALQALTTWFDDESVKATAEQAAIGVVTRINRNRRLKSVIAKNKEEILAILKGIKDTSKNEKNAAQAAKLYKELGGK
ncbi:MAG: hypothetical protein GY794_12935, partial [bacterium]|nr:hypothetical protein [bacterium]